MSRPTPASLGPQKGKKAHGSGQQYGKGKAGRFSPYSGHAKDGKGASAKAAGKPKRTGQDERLKEQLATEVDMVDLVRLVNGKEEGKPEPKQLSGTALSIAVEAAHIQTEQKARKEFEGSFAATLDTLGKLGT